MHTKTVISLLFIFLYLFNSISPQEATSPKTLKMTNPGPHSKNFTAQYIRETIESNKVAIFSKSYCPYSTTAKEQFQKLNFPFLTVELDDRPDCDRIQTILGEMTGSTTVPRVFVNGNCIGGGTDVKTLYETGELGNMLNLLLLKN